MKKEVLLQVAKALVYVAVVRTYPGFGDEVPEIAAERFNVRVNRVYDLGRTIGINQVGGRCQEDSSVILRTLIGICPCRALVVTANPPLHGIAETAAYIV